MKPIIFAISFLYCFLFFSCNKQQDIQTNQTPKIEVYKIHDYYDSDSIVIEYPDGRIKKVKKGTDDKEEGLRTSKTGETATTNAITKQITAIFSPIIPENPDPTEEYLTNLAVWSFSCYASQVSLEGTITDFENVYVHLENPTTYFTSNGYDVTRKAQVFADEVSWDCTPLLPCPQTVFTWHWRLNCVYVYSPYRPSITKQFLYDKSKLCKG